MVEHSRVYTLLELLICLTILMILFSASIPDFSHWKNRREADRIINEISTLINMTRSYAISNNIMMTLCRSDDGLACQGSWEQGSIIFSDENADHIVNGNDRIFFRTPALDITGTIKLRAFQNKQYLQMTPRGFTNYQNGNFTYCPANNDNKLAQQIILSLSGRVRFALDNDGDGIREDSKGEALSCA